MASEFGQRRRERFLNEGSYTAFVRGSNMDLEDSLLLLRDELPHLPDDDPAYRQWTSEVMLRRVELLIGRYSAGNAISEIAAQFPSTLHAVEANALPHPRYRTEPFRLAEIDTYAYAMWLLSLCKLLRLDPLLPRVLAVFDVARADNRGTDALFEALVGALGGSDEPVKPAGSMLKILKAHPILLQAIQAEPSKRPLYMAEFLKRWYPAMKSCYWYNRHERVPQNFFGYWAFEAGLVTLLWNIDDKGYRELPFYPKDLVDYARARPDVDHAALAENSASKPNALTVAAGKPCPREGWWTTPVHTGSRRRFAGGELMPELGGSYGTTIWQWDDDQTP